MVELRHVYSGFLLNVLLLGNPPLLCDGFDDVIHKEPFKNWRVQAVDFSPAGRLFEYYKHTLPESLVERTSKLRMQDLVLNQTYFVETVIGALQMGVITFLPRKAIYFIFGWTKGHYPDMFKENFKPFHIGKGSGNEWPLCTQLLKEAPETFVDPFNRFIVSLRESGIFEFWSHETFHKIEHEYATAVQRLSPENLPLDALTGLFEITSSLLTWALIVLICEAIYNKWGSKFKIHIDVSTKWFM